MSKLTKVVFEEARWRKGRLTRSVPGDREPTHCALGFYLNQLGIPDRLTEGQSVPSTVVGRSGAESLGRLAEGGAEWLVCPRRDTDGKIVGWSTSKDAEEIMAINDSKRGKAERLTRIRTIFAKHGVEIHYVESSKKKAE